MAQDYRACSQETYLTTINLTKLETAHDQVRKALPKLLPTDAALVASAISLVGRHALAIYEGEQYSWPEDYVKLTAAMARQIEMIQESTEVVKRTKSSPEEEPVQVTIGLMPNLTAGDTQLAGHDKLKTAMSDMVQEGVEFVYQHHDVMWQWALDRANWSVIIGEDLTRKVRVRASFTEGAVGIEMGVGGKRKPTRKAAKVVEQDDPTEE
ncbi:MAG: hypothetical protein ABL962_00125 [Fimbriimonadaceae bacterium]